MKTKDKDSVLTYINERIIENQQEMAAANAAGDNRTYFTCVGVRTALEAVRGYIGELKEEADDETEK